MAQNFTPGSPAAISYLNKLLRLSGVDVKAADSVFNQEGLHGGIGDSGHAFGPGQFNDAGGVWTGRYAGMNPQQKNAAAWSPAGLKELVASVAKVAAGRHGSDAIANIVKRFERPQDPNGEIQRALAGIGSSSLPPNSLGPLTQPDVAPQDGSSGIRGALLQSLMAQNQSFASGGTVSPSTTLAALFKSGLGAGSPSPAAAITASPGGPPVAMPQIAVDKNGKLKILGSTQGLDPGFFTKVQQALGSLGASELQINSGYRSKDHNAEIGGAPDSNHLTGHALDGMAMVNGQWVPIGQLLAKTAGKYGLRSGASFNWAGKPDIVHVDDNYNQGR